MILQCVGIISACSPPPTPPNTAPCGLFDCCTKRNTKCQFPFTVVCPNIKKTSLIMNNRQFEIQFEIFTFKHTGYYDDTGVTAQRRHDACGVLIDNPVNPNTNFRCFDGDSYQQCNMIYEFQFGLCLPGYRPSNSDNSRKRK